MCMVDAAEDVRLLSDRVITRARKEHKCDECCRTIDVGETYRSLGYTDDYSCWYSHKLCAHCQIATQWLTDNCGGYVYHAVAEDLIYHLREEFDQTLPIWWPMARVYKGMARQWRRKGGFLMRVPDPIPAMNTTIGEE
jgi:hypothetical protein